MLHEKLMTYFQRVLSTKKKEDDVSVFLFPPKLTMASVAGGVVGSAMGLALTGPVGAAIGRSCGIICVSFIAGGFHAGVHCTQELS